MKDYEWNFYAVRNDNLLVLGFEDGEDAKDYCKRHKFKLFTRNGLKNKKINPAKIESWTCDKEVPEY